MDLRFDQVEKDIKSLEEKQACFRLWHALWIGSYELSVFVMCGPGRMWNASDDN